jgi:hypothetical protein
MWGLWWSFKALKQQGIKESNQENSCSPRTLEAMIGSSYLLCSIERGKQREFAHDAV